MNSKELDKRVEKAFSSVCPDILDSVVTDSRQKKGELTDISEIKNQVPAEKHSYSRYLRAAAVLLLCIMTFSVFGLVSKAHAVSSAVIIDVNPSVELKLNSRGRVVDAVCLNSDASVLTEDIKLKGLPVDEALELLLDELIAGNYLNSGQNSVLLSVECPGGADAGELSDRLNARVYTSLKERGFTPSVLSQTLDSSDSELMSLSEELNISPGKARLISGIKTGGADASLQALSELSINELNLILDCQSGHEDILSRGSVNAGVYVNADEAVLTAGASVSAEDCPLRNCSVSMSCGEGGLVYSVSFDVGVYHYSCTVDAATGRVSHSSSAYADDFSGWLDGQSSEFRDWISGNIDSVQSLAKEYRGDWKSWLKNRSPDSGIISDIITDSLQGLLDILGF